MPPQSNPKVEGNVVDDAAVNLPSKKSGSDSGVAIAAVPRKQQTLADRNRIPPSFYLLTAIIIGFQYYGGVYSLDTLSAWKSSIVTSYVTTTEKLAYLKDLMQATAAGEVREPKEYAIALITTLLCASIFYVLIWSPLRAGMWTGTRARRHKIHRYLGLLYLIQYASAWTEFITNYENGKNSYLPHFIALNGIIQGASAYFSFKVLPELADAGYYSDKAVLSRIFVHENMYFTLLAVTGSCMYNDLIRENVVQHLGGKILQYTFVFFPYILVRTWFPFTQFSNAGSSMAGRSTENELFYRVGTLMVKVFYLWAKYFLGFYINFLVFLNKQTEENMRFIRGLFLLNAGTVSIAVFLHTLRFKKVLPPKLTFSIYLAQIYA